MRELLEAARAGGRVHAKAAWDRPMLLFRWTLAVLLVGAAVSWMAITVHWPILWDTQVMHYVNFMMDHGREPYRDITDMNMPGAYLTDRWATAIFGRGDLAWRMYDFALMGALTLAMMVIARPYDWFAGLVAGVFYALMHGLEGPLNAAQRDLVMTVFVVIAYAFLFEAIRERRAWLMVGFGLCSGIAAAIKPTIVPFALLLLGAAMVAARRRGQRWAWTGMCGALGLGLAGAIVLGFLLRHGSLGAFIFILRRVIPQYAGLGHASMVYLLHQALPTPLVVLLPVAAWLGWRHRSWTGWERPALVAGAVAGFLSYYAQRKGYVYHRYMLVAFLLLWMTIELAEALKERGVARAVGVACLAGLTLLADTRYLQVLRASETEDKYAEFARYLEADLDELGPARLKGEVECMDMVFGCLNALYHLRIEQYSGATGDMLYFQPSALPLTQHYRQMFAGELERRPPPDVFVVSNGWFDHPNSFGKVNEWPEFAATLRNDYVMVRGRSFHGHGVPPHGPAEGTPTDPAYEIFVRRGSDLAFHPSSR